MAEQWTAEQREAIGRTGNVLCAAAAGAGKTAVLSQRVLERVTSPVDPVDIDQLLIVTFTRAAAAEMRQRIAAKLREAAGTSARARAQLWRLPQADITTLHGFCERTVRRAFTAAEVDPGFRLLDPAEARLLWAQSLSEALDRRLAGPEAPALAGMLARYGGRWGDTNLPDLVGRLDRFAQSQEDPAAWLAAQRDRLRDPDLRAALGAAGEGLRQLALLATMALTLTARPGGPEQYRPALEADQAMFADLARRAETGPWDAFAQALASAGFGTLPRVGKTDDPGLAAQCRTLRDQAKEKLRQLAAGPHGRPEAELRAEVAATAAQLDPLLDLVRDQRAAFQEGKARLRALDFDDLEHRAAALLADPQECAAICARYREVLVDEAQDLSPVQDTLLERLTGQAPLFCVGDARQSIYGFRQAEPRRFLARSRRYAREGGGSRVDLSHNFRSRANIVAGVNLLFGPLLGSVGSGLPAADAGPLRPAATYPDQDPPLELHLLEREVTDAEEGLPLEREALAVAELVVRWLAEARVQTPRGPRPAEPADVAILLRAIHGVADTYVAALRARGLPVWAPDPGGRAASPEGRTLLSWLRTLENPRQDLMLAATLRGPFGGFEDAELARIRLAQPGGDLWDAVLACARSGPPELAARLRAWLSQLDAWRAAARQRPFADLVADGLETTAFAEYVRGLPGGVARRRTLEALLDRCRLADRLPRADLSRLIEFLEQGDDGETVAEAAQAAGNVVRLMSVHASKGLEFPLVVAAGLGRQLPLGDARGTVLVHREAGVGAAAVDPDLRRRWPTVRQVAVAQHLVADARAEELRVLYVALTRARERLALVGTARLQESADAWLARRGSPPDLSLGASALDWFGPLLAAHPDVAPVLAELGGGGPASAVPPDPWESRWLVQLAPAARPVAPAVPAGWATPCPQVAARLAAEAAWRYPHGALGQRAAKVSVGELSLMQREAEEQPLRLGPRADPEPQLRVAARDAVTAAEAGSAAHLVLAKLDLAGACDEAAVRACIEELTRRNLLAARLAEAVRPGVLARALDLEAGLRLRAAARRAALWREVPFTLRVPAAEVYGEPQADNDAWVLVQGVIDAVAREEESLLLVDYKTDRLRGPADLARQSARHAAQVRWYARAAQAAWELPVREAVLVFLSGAQAVPVPLVGW